MSSIEIYVTHIKPALDEFLKTPTKQNIKKLKCESENCDWVQLKIYNAQILVPLLIKLDEMNDENQDVRVAVIDCIRFIISKLYLDKVKALSSVLAVLLKQVRYPNATTKPNLSEEIKLAVVLCVKEAIQRSTSDVLEQFYVKEMTTLLAQLLVTCLEFLENEKYKKIVLAVINCIMVIFNVHDEADAADIVLRKQVADILFLFLPRHLTSLLKLICSNDTVGESVIALSVEALGRIICLMFEDTTENFLALHYDSDSFRNLIKPVQCTKLSENDLSHILLCKKNGDLEYIQNRIKVLQNELRSSQWMNITSRQLRPIFIGTITLRSHTALNIRKAYAEFSCLLLERCACNLQNNLIFIFENVLAMTEDNDASIAKLCQITLKNLQSRETTISIFDNYAEHLLDTHMKKLPRILYRCDEAEQYAELLFLKAFLRNLSDTKLPLLLSVSTNMGHLVKCLLVALKLKTQNLMNEEYALGDLACDLDYTESAKLPWRRYKHLNSKRCITEVYHICAFLGKTPILNRIIFDYCMELLETHQCSMNEVILLVTLVATEQKSDKDDFRLDVVQILLEELLNEKHWHLALHPDPEYRLKVDKATSWFVERTPGLYESGYEMRKQDCESQDDIDLNIYNKKNYVSIADTEFNILHTCIVLDSLGHCAKFMGVAFDCYTFRSLHHVLLNLASSNSHIYRAANFAFISMQRALNYAEAPHFIEEYIDYVNYHLNNLLKRLPTSKTALDILTVVLQYSSRNNIPHLDCILQTIKCECAKTYQAENVPSYLKVYNAFLQHVRKWQLSLKTEIDKEITMEMDDEITADEILSNWLSILNESEPQLKEISIEESVKEPNNLTQPSCAEDDCDEEIDMKHSLPHHIEMVKDIINQIIKILPSSVQVQQILALECLISGVPILKDYEDELLPLVHLIWQPLVEKFRQKDALVLNRCFTLLNILGIHAKGFILKRSLDDVIPFLKQFLEEAAIHSGAEHLLAKTQEYKLQLKLLKNFASLIINLEIDSKQLYEIGDTVGLYLSRKQPQELQNLAVKFYESLISYNGPFIYTVVKNYENLEDYKKNVETFYENIELVPKA